MIRRKGVGSLVRWAAICMCLSMGGGSVRGVTLDEVQQAVAAMESAIQDVTIEYDWYLDPPTPQAEIAGKRLLREVSRANKSFATARPFSERQLSSTTVDLEDGDGHRFTARYSRSYDGTVVKYLSNSGWPQTRLEGAISKRTDNLESWNLSPMGFTILRDYPQLLSEAITNNPKGFKIEDRIQKINGFNTICLALVLPEGAVYRRVYLSVDHGYAPVRFAYLKPPSGELNWSVEVKALERVSNGIWFPTKGSIPDSNNFYEAKTVQVNRGLPIEYFDIKFPAGTRITDDIAGIEYVTGSETSVDDKQRSADASAQESQGMGRHWTGGKWLLAGGAMLLGILVAVMYLRRSRHALRQQKGKR